jgi:hypothetical protein
VSETDARLERLIADIARSLVVTKDRRFSELLKRAVSLRSPERVERMEREKGLRAHA